jgi:DNA-binding response OmpR family regulator
VPTYILKHREFAWSRLSLFLPCIFSPPKKTFSRSQLLDEFWGVDASTSLRSVDVYITKLREKFSACEDFKIVTIHGLGYKAVLK